MRGRSFGISCLLGLCILDSDSGFQTPKYKEIYSLKSVNTLDNVL